MSERDVGVPYGLESRDKVNAIQERIAFEHGLEGLINGKTYYSSSATLGNQ